MTHDTAPREREAPAIALQERVRLLEVRIVASQGLKAWSVCRDRLVAGAVRM
jgi:hypothetical protein